MAMNEQANKSELFILLAYIIFYCCCCCNYCSALATTTNPWSRIAYICSSSKTVDNKDNNNISSLFQVHVVPPPHHNVQVVLPNSNQSFNLSNAREWMEYVAHNYYTTKLNFGAYTVIRCEKLFNTSDTFTKQQEWKIWGLDFHLNRLKVSYSTMYATTTTKDHNCLSIEDACKQSRHVIDKLLLEGNNIISNYATTTTTTPSTATTTRVVIMLTLLWTKNNGNDNGNAAKSKRIIDVYGHARQILVMPLEKEVLSSSHGITATIPGPIVAMIAMPSIQTNELEHNGADNPKSQQHDTSVDMAKLWLSLPRRYDRIPEAKLSSWCYERRSLEDNFKLHGIGEVLLARPQSTAALVDDSSDSNDIELLEGLTSNLFVLYKDGTLRTASNGVLQGYSRHLIFQSILKHDKFVSKVDFNPPLLSEAHLWKEVFLSSSIQLLRPIRKIMIRRSSCHSENNNNDLGEKFVIVWEECNTSDSFTNKLFHELMINCN